MGVRDECRSLVRQGTSPSEIARRRKISLKSVFSNLDELIGRGDLRRSDVAFTVPPATRKAIADLLGKGHSPLGWRLERTLRLQKSPVEVADIETVLRYGTVSGVLGEMYEDIRSIEVGLHRTVRLALEEEYGRGELGWWRKGVPDAIRASCQTKREQDEDPVSEAYNYTDLMELREITVKNWDVVRRKLPQSVGADRKQLGSDLARLNGIRRNVMHPVRDANPAEDDFQFVHTLRDRLGHVPVPEGQV